MPPPIKNVDELIEYFDERFEVYRDVSVEPQFTLITRPSNKMANEIMHLSSVLKIKDPRHLYYTKEMLHLTLFGNIAPDLDVENFHSFVREITSGLEVSFHAHGVSRFAAVVTEPQFSLFNYRKKLANFLKVDDEQQYLSWFNLLRAKYEPNKAMAKFLRDNRSKDFGSFKPETLDLYLIKSKVMDDSWEKVFSVPVNDINKE